MKAKKRVAIIGAGATGLSAALWLEDNSNHTYAIYEATSRVGGKVVTYTDHNSVVEGGADSYLERKESMTRLIERVGLSDQLVHNEVGQAYILKQGQLYPNPKRTVLGVPTDLDLFMETDLISAEGKRELLNEFNKPRLVQDGEDVSLGDFFEYRLGKEMVTSLIEPLLGGIYGGNIYELSMRATFPHFLRYEAEHGSILRALETTKPANSTVKQQGMFLTVKSGLQSVLEAAAEQLKKGVIYYNHRVKKINRLDNGTYTLLFNDGATKEYDNVLITLPPKKASQLTGSDELIKEASVMEATSCATVALTFNKGEVVHRNDGTGFVVARGGDETITACTWTDSKWPHTNAKGETLLRAYVGRPDHSAIVDQSEEEIVEAVLGDLNKVMKITGKPLRTIVTRWKEAMPQYKVGHLKRIEHFKSILSNEFPGVFVAGAGFEGVGLPDCVNQGIEAAKQLNKK